MPHIFDGLGAVRHQQAAPGIYRCPLLSAPINEDGKLPVLVVYFAHIHSANQILEDETHEG